MRQTYLIQTEDYPLWAFTNSLTPIGLKQRLTKERRDGRWAQAWRIIKGLERPLRPLSELKVHFIEIQSMETGEMKTIGGKLQRPRSRFNKTYYP